MEPSEYRVVITDCDHGSIREEKEEFDRMGAELILAQVREEEELIRVGKEADGLINQYALLTRRIFENLPKCKVVARYGVGVDHRPQGSYGFRHYHCQCTGLLY
jgi:D-3-phosphoglycerate dehydrogenase